MLPLRCVSCTSRTYASIFPAFFFLAEMGDYSQSFNLVISPYSNDLKAKLPVTLSHTPCLLITMSVLEPFKAPI